jgi:hypothetical protein
MRAPRLLLLYKGGTATRIRIPCTAYTRRRFVIHRFGLHAHRRICQIFYPHNSYECCTRTQTRHKTPLRTRNPLDERTRYVPHNGSSSESAGSSMCPATSYYNGTVRAVYNVHSKTTNSAYLRTCCSYVYRVKCCITVRYTTSVCDDRRGIRCYICISGSF